MDDIITKLTSYCSISGNSEEVGHVFIDEASLYGCICGFDALGSVSARINANNVPPGQTPPRLMISAHIDTIGYLVRDVERSNKFVDGNIILGRVGAPNLSYYADGRIKTSSGYYEVKISDDGDEENLALCRISENNLDKVQIGDPVFFNNPAKITRGKIRASGLDNKASITSIMLFIKKISLYKNLKYNIFCVLPEVEETRWSQGVFAATNKIKPHFAINLDVLPVYKENRLGRGVAICTGPLINKKLFHFVKSIAEQFKIKHIIKAEPGMLSSDLDMIVLANGGTPAIEINIPCYGLHSPNEVVSKKDVLGASELLYRICTNLDSLPKTFIVGE